MPFILKSRRAAAAMLACLSQSVGRTVTCSTQHIVTSGCLGSSTPSALHHNERAPPQWRCSLVKGHVRQVRGLTQSLAWPVAGPVSVPDGAPLFDDMGKPSARQVCIRLSDQTQYRLPALWEPPRHYVMIEVRGHGSLIYMRQQSVHALNRLIDINMLIERQIRANLQRLGWVKEKEVCHKSVTSMSAQLSRGQQFRITHGSVNQCVRLCCICRGSK